MISFRLCKDWHIALIEVQDAQLSEKPFYMGALNDYAENSLAMSCWLGDECVGAGGLRPVWVGRAVAWALLGRKSGPAMPAIVRKLRWVLSTYPANRVEMTVRSEFEPGCRLAALLGFDAEATLRRFNPDGSDARLFARIQG